MEELRGWQQADFFSLGCGSLSVKFTHLWKKLDFYDRKHSLDGCRIHSPYTFEDDEAIALDDLVVLDAKSVKFQALLVKDNYQLTVVFYSNDLDVKKGSSHWVSTGIDTSTAEPT